MKEIYYNLNNNNFIRKWTTPYNILSVDALGITPSTKNIYN